VPGSAKRGTKPCQAASDNEEICFQWLQFLSIPFRGRVSCVAEPTILISVWEKRDKGSLPEAVPNG